MSPEVAGAVVDEARGHGSIAGHAPAKLVPRERQVLTLLADRNSSSEIGAQLHISVSTVEVHRRNIMRKLNLHGIAELTKYAIREGLTSP